jgi:hypothetical protein
MTAQMAVSIADAGLNPLPLMAPFDRLDRDRHRAVEVLKRSRW